MYVSLQLSVSEQYEESTIWLRMSMLTCLMRGASKFLLSTFIQYELDLYTLFAALAISGLTTSRI